MQLPDSTTHAHLDSIWLWFAKNFIWCQPCQLLLPDVLHILNYVRERAELLRSITQEAQPFQQRLAAATAAAAARKGEAAQQQQVSEQGFQKQKLQPSAHRK
jgi:hypothetical protein